ncbi:hypothetical protein WDJ51_08985 [Rathayibacter sp. YIM 133350]|uniref:hypothetical protein n=1 Tax=Rathayibacter sp. YIM 133350 TaxID=3131992 RepID=UPI00307CDC60
MPADAVFLSVFGLSCRLQLLGDAALEAKDDIERAWSRCLTSPLDAGPVPDLDIPLVIAADAAPALAEHPGAVVASDRAELLHALSPAVTTRALDAVAGRYYLLHACGVALDDGGVVAFVAASGVGKTTLATTLSRRFGYVSDETVIVRFDGTVLAYPKPLSVLEGTDSSLKRQVSADELGLLVAPDDLHLAGVVLLDRSDDADEYPDIEEVPVLHGLAAMTEQTSYLTRMPQPLTTAVRLVEAAGGIRRVRYREAASIEPFVDVLQGAAR